jgi:hypothetical protein
VTTPRAAEYSDVRRMRQIFAFCGGNVNSVACRTMATSAFERKSAYAA